MGKVKKIKAKRICEKCGRKSCIPFSAGCLSGIRVCTGCNERVENCTCKPLKKEA